MWLKQSTAVEIKIGPFVDNTDGFTAETGLTIAQADVRLAKNGADWAQKNETTTMVHEENGNYRCLLDATDTNTLGLLVVSILETGALPVRQDYMVLAANIYDSLLGGGDILDVSVAAMAANVLTATAINADAITAAKVAPDVHAEAADAVWDEARAGHVAAGSFGEGVASVQGNVTGSLLGNVGGDVQGNVDGSVASVGPGGIVAATFGAGAIDATAIATGAIDADALAADTITAAKVASGTLTNAKFAADAIDSTVLADNTITAAKINAAALTASKFDTDVGDKLRAVHVPGGQLAQGTADSGTTTTMVDAARTEADTDYWKGCYLEFTSGTIAGQVRLITAFTPGSDTFTFAPATTQAVGTNTYNILPGARADVELWDGSAVNALVSGRVDASVGAMAADVVTAAAIATNAIDADAIASDAVTEIQSGLATAAALATVQADTDDIQTRLPAALVSGRMDSSVGAMAANVITAAALDPTAGAEFADAVWDEARAGHVTAGTFGEGVASVQGDVQGDVVGSVGAVLTLASNSIDAAAISSAGANKIADHTHRRTYANIRASSDGDTLNKRSLAGAIAKAVNRVAISGATMTIYNEDDSTSTAPGGTQTLTTSAGADPIIEQDP